MITLSYVPFGLSQYLYFHRIEMRDGANQIVGHKVTVIKHEEQDADPGQRGIKWVSKWNKRGVKE